MLSSFQAFTSATLILYEASQKQLHGFAKDCWDYDLKTAESPLSTLKFCGELDPVAKRFYEALLPHHKAMLQFGDPKANTLDGGHISSPHSTQYLCQIPTDADESLLQQSLVLRKLLCRPFGEPERKQNPEPRRMEIEHLDWHLGSSVPFNRDASKHAEEQSEKTRNLHVQHQANNFLGSKQPLGWAPAPDDAQILLSNSEVRLNGETFLP